ncbi:glutamyl-tRNA(Gln) amidotransferase C subunit [Zymomonas mobilis subsp. mobilis ZM4 = ATCC 31821]|uniref:Aspartyl/glutamyl-tRNA(Asn/Gln) amidotransferase subunit C n=2 Tax=Zymomonas mobilis subsp. mobilis TaxID=120045 RepID=Q5NPF2_ZYMMO|nr:MULTISPECIES: Asp-tRNA(Asn)/Glu-tRNA(Gln) amidotransferase subunit GatC [Zymomonas]AAV89408.1 glutamyl-tRNA(Gln) amidotransferase, C subunit [Zymomonas mobilis subsp. mobilis ZM4 = ATCC 31821]ACV75047.1 glutamyl-tRNA(Gln) amidotransferase, C subunit [Zymomonas mobilis subsp. mobilis NCIMB 11163]AEH62353.1 glutamyl-tRNA(Gln) amidotransferase, C subunit [Zymomonas mobilis subsp. mobilis ATCC 10988]AFN56407.1 Aspartyl/glutamyl-tRNA(Asn/Gln) amidotransferase subunit C [Zymomonas mobilis subsp. m
MSVINASIVRKIAKLASIAVTEEEVTAMVPELNAILGWGEQLSAINTDGVEPLTSVIAQSQRLREDEVTVPDIRDALMANAPEAEHGFFTVPKVIE